jgi:hypothetical protein
MGVVDDVTFGIGGTLMQVTGLSDKIAEGVQQLNEMGKEIGYESQTNKMQSTLFNMIKDPRLDDYYNQLRNVSRQNSEALSDDQYGKELGKAVNVPHNTQQDKFLAVHHFTDLNVSLLASQKTKTLMNTVNMLRGVVGDTDIPGFDWQQIDDGIQQANIRGPEAIQNVIDYFTTEIATKVLPVAQQILASQPPPPQVPQGPQQVPQGPPQPVAPEKEENTTEYIKRAEPKWNKADEDQYPVRHTQNVHFDKKARTEAYRSQEYGKKKGSGTGSHRSVQEYLESMPKSKWEAYRAAKAPRIPLDSKIINGEKQQPSAKHKIHG